MVSIGEPLVAELHHFGGAPAIAALAWRLAQPLLVASTAPVGGGLGQRDWVLNVQVPHGYRRRDTDEHVAEVSAAIGLDGRGVAMLTAAEVSDMVSAAEAGVQVQATVGLRRPVWAAAADPAEPAAAGTINVVAFVPAHHSDAALANLLCTVTEAKVQALLHRGVAGTGTASDAVTVLCPRDGTPEPFGGPRSRHGGALARAVFAAVAGARAPA